MILQANDFGTVPDDRFIERASMVAGSDRSIAGRI